MNFKWDINKLRAQVCREYDQGYQAISTIRDEKRDQLQKVFPNATDKDLKIGLIYRNIQLENSLFLTDEINVDLVTDDWVLSKELVANAKKALKYDDETMDWYYMREDIINHNGIYWVSVTIIDWWDDEEKQPISATIDPLSIVPDPKNWRGNNMRFFWIERRLLKEWLNKNVFFNIDKIQCIETSDELRKNDDAYNDIDWTNSTSEQEWLFDAYDHFTIRDWKKVLTTWANQRNDLIRYVEIEPLNNKEKNNLNKVKFPIQIHRRKPKIWCFFWVSIIEEVAQYQDMVSKLANLQLIQARISALWPDKFIDQNLWVDISLLWEKLPWWRVIPVKWNSWNIGNSMFTDIYPNPSQFPTQMRNELESYSQKTTWVTDLAFWTSLPWSQTKAEIQTLQSNANTILSYIGNNYLRWQKEYWEQHYATYVKYMTNWQKKRVSMFDKWEPISLTLRREDFVTSGKVLIYVTSKSEQEAKDSKDTVKLISLANLYLWNMKPWYSLNEFLRKIGNSSWIQNFDAYKFIPMTPDEMRAVEYLDWLNRNEKAPDPKPWEDYMTYIQIYKQAMDTPAKWEAILKYTNAYKASWQEQTQETGQWDATTWAMAMNNIVSWQAEQSNSLQDIRWS